LAETLLLALERLTHCQQCRAYTEDPLCPLCADSQRDIHMVCVVESTADVWLVEQSGAFNGQYFVLHGRLSPLDGIGPDELGLAALEQRLAGGAIQELVLATNATVEGEATAYFINELASKHQVKATRLAQGVPIGGELEFIDSGTLARAFNGRRAF
jgi:recombination protein RecR